MRKFLPTPPRRSAKALAAPLGLCCLLLLSAAEARADAVRLLARSELNASAATAQYPGGALSLLGSPFSFSAGGNTLTFSNGGNFQRQDDGSFSYETDFATGTRIVLSQTGGDGVTTISFGTAVTEFGFDIDTPTAGGFTVEVYNGAALLTSFELFDVTAVPGLGPTVFAGARASNGDLITHVVIRGQAAGTGLTQNYALGPVSFVNGTAAPEPVPEPATLVLLGTGLAGALGVARRRRRRRADDASRAD